MKLDGLILNAYGDAMLDYVLCDFIPFSQRILFDFSVGLAQEMCNVLKIECRVLDR